MSTSGQRLVFLSGLPSGTAAQHLLAIKQSGVTAGQMLLSRSALLTGTAGQHLLDSGVPAGSRTGNLAAIEAADIFAANGGTGAGISGTFNGIELGADSFASLGNVLTFGSFGATEVGQDALASLGSVLVTGSISATDQTDSLAAAGSVLVTGSWAVTEVGADSLSAVGSVATFGVFVTTETGADQLAAAGLVVTTGALAGVEFGVDTLSASGLTLVSGALAVGETGQDVFAASGSAFWVPVVGVAAATETATDQLSGFAKLLVRGTIVGIEQPDQFSGTAKLIVKGAQSAQETGDDSFFAIDLLRFGYWNKIKSEVVTRRIKLDVSTVEIDLNPVAQQIKLNPYAAVISANVAAVQARMDVQAQLLALTYKIGVFLKFAFFDEKAQLSDAITGFDIGKGASDAVSAIDKLLFGLNRPLQDGFVAFSQHAAHLGKQLGEDAFQTIDSEVLSVVKGLNDIPAARDALRADIYKALADAAKVLDSISRGSGKALTDAAAASDTRSSSVTKALADAARSSDAANRSTVKQLFDAARAIEAITVGLFKAAADGARASDAANRGVGKPLLDSTTALDSALKSFTRPLLDGARALDAITVIRGKNFFDVVGATDDFDGALSLEDDQEMVFSKSVSDSAFIISTFNRQIGYNRTYGDSAQVTDIVTNTSGKGHFDVAGVGSSGTLRSQSYCEASYFAEDYVGDSRNFS